MRIRDRLFPYPVLCGDTDDYDQNTEFALTQDIKETVHELVLQYDFELNCVALEALLRKGDAEYVLHIECSTTAFRVALKSGVPQIQYRLQKSKVNGEVNLVAMIVAKKDIFQYTSEQLNEDYLEESITFRKGSILAYQNLPPIYVKKKTEELANSDPYFTVIKHTSLDPDEVKPLSFNLAHDKIQIFVDTKTYEAYVRYRQTRSIAMALLVLPALTYMIAEAGENPSTYAGYSWFQRMKKYYNIQGLDFVEDVLRKDENPVIIAQEMLQNPVSIAYRDLNSLEV